MSKMLFLALAFFIAFCTAADEVDGQRIYEFHQTKQHYRANLRPEDVQVAPRDMPGLELDPARKRHADEFLATDADLQLPQNPAVCLNGANNCTKCDNELSYYSCSVCYYCCRRYVYGFGYIYYPCDVCQVRYCYFCRNSYHSVNGTCYDYSKYLDSNGPLANGNCPDANAYPLYCTDNNTQVVMAENQNRPTLIANINTAWAQDFLQSLLPAMVVTGISDFVYYNNLTSTTIYCTITYTFVNPPDVNQTVTMLSDVTTVFSNVYNIQQSRIYYLDNSTATPGSINVTIMDNAGTKGVVSFFLIALSMVFLLF